MGEFTETQPKWDPKTVLTTSQVGNEGMNPGDISPSLPIEKVERVKGETNRKPGSRLGVLNIKDTDPYTQAALKRRQDKIGAPADRICFLLFHGTTQGLSN